MSDLRTNPFQHRPRFLAAQPRLIRLYVFHCIIGFALSGVFTGLILWSNTANIGHLVTHVEGGWLAAFVFFVLNGIVFAGVQTGIVIMSLGKMKINLGVGAATPSPQSVDCSGQSCGSRRHDSVKACLGNRRLPSKQAVRASTNLRVMLQGGCRAPVC